MIEIRQASAEQIEPLTQLFIEYLEFYQLAASPQKAKAFLTKRLSAKDSIIFVAFDQQTITGFVQIYPSFSSAAMRPIWLLNDLYVTQCYRRQGVARQLLKATEFHASKANIMSIKLATGHKNNIAQALYISLGYQQNQEFQLYSKNLTLC